MYKPYVYDPTRASGKRWLRTFTDLAEAQAVRDAAWKESPRGDRELTISELIDRFLTFDGADAPTERTRNRYRPALEPLKRQFGRRYANGITRP